MAIWSEKKYNRINWQNRPSTATALGATNLNKIDVFCNEVDNAMIQMDAQKLNLSTANSMISSLTINVDTGVITAKQLDGTTFTWDLNLEKIPVSFSLSEDGILTMTTEDGTEWTCNISELIKDYVFDDSDTIAFEKEFSEEDESGKGAYHVTASVKAGSINETHLDPDYRADILTYKNQAQTAANDALTYSKDSKRWAVGDSEYEGSDIDNSKYYKEQAESAKVAAEQARDEAQAATGTVIATTEQVGVVKPDGTTIGVTSDGTISAKSATSTSAGIIKPDGETVTVDEYGVLHVLDADKLGGELPSYYAKQDDVGEKTNLTTTAKTDLVAAINEVDGNIGDLSGLTTTAKTNLVSAVNELNQKFSNNAGSHNGIYRGKNLGSSVTESQWQAISSGTFEDLYIGDYWIINGVNWRIAAFDYYLNCGDTNFTQHHVVIVPDTCLYNAQMNAANATTTGAYKGSAMYTANLAQAKSTINSAFGSSHVLSHRIYLSNATSNGRASAGEWTDSTVDLMCEHMVYGSGIFSPVSDGSSVPNNYRVEKGQLPLFALEPSRICNRATWWLRDVITVADFAVVNGTGHASYGNASNSLGVRPAFCIG